MNPWQADVQEFHRWIGAHYSTFASVPVMRRPELRAELIREESKELRTAIKRRDMLATIDGICDLLVVTIGAATEFGIDIDPFWAEVHQSNLAKAGGPVREDGKVLKPEGWQPPNLEAVYRNLYGA